MNLRPSYRALFQVPITLAIVAIAALTVAACTNAVGPLSSEQAATSTTRPIRVMHWRDPNTPRIESAPPGAHLTYYGGRVISNVQVVEVLYGSGNYASYVSSTASPSMATFYGGVTNSPYMDWLTEYNTPTGTHQTIGRGTFLRQVQITPSSANDGSTIDDSNIQAELAAQIGAGSLPAPTTDSAGNDNTLYMVHFPHGKTITQGGSSSCVGGGFCAYHGTISNAGGHEVYYGVLPDMQSGSGCDVGCGSGTPFGNQTSVASHEMIESVTDSEVGIATTVGPPLAWYDTNNGEIGDICNAQQGSIVGGDGVTYTVQQEFSNVANDCIVSRTVANDFSLSLSPTSLSITQGSSGTSTVSTAIASGSAESISLTVSGAPSGVTASLSPSSVNSGGSSTLSVTVASTAVAGNYTLTVTGTASSGSHTATLALTVRSSTTTNDFSIAVSPSSISVAQGSGGTSTVSTAIVSGSAETISLSVSGLPSGTTASFSPTSVTSGGSSTLSITVGSATATGSYSLTVTGTAASGSHATTLGLTVTSGTTGGGIVNGGFETGSLSGWTSSGAHEGVVSSGAHSGTYAAMLGNTTPTNGDSTIAQTFTAPSGTTGISLWYKMTCPDTVTYDWASVSLKDNTTGMTATLLSPICTTNAWTQVTGAVTAGHSYTVTLLSHDDNYGADPSYTLYDDVTLTSSAPPPPGITNGGFETGSLSGWTASGAHEAVVSSGAHSGTYAAMLGNTTPTNGDSTVAQSFTAPAGTSKLTVWYKMTCPDTVTYDWATVTLHDNTTGTTATLLGKTCTNNAWTQLSASVVAGHSYTLTLLSHDDNYGADPSYTLYDDAALQ